uniref:Uncharacterized protein n=1 Tax=Glossina morsitans morsitans TaxID=37546 RepID=A0A1B0FK64_GLOMM
MWEEKLQEIQWQVLRNVTTMVTKLVAITDFPFSPMVLMMILPLFLLLVLPKMIKDLDTKNEVESISFPKINDDMPKISEMLTSFFSGETSRKTKTHHFQ